jgi:TetR/AcrR family transcriptional regulator, tetracycline repressor protein
MAEEKKGRGAGLSREKVLAAALAVADAEGLEAVSFRRLASDLGVTPMALYRYVDDKEALLDGIGDLVLSQLELPEPPTGDWREQLRAAARSYRVVLGAHPGSVPIFLSRPLMTPARMRAANAVLGIFRRAGFSPEQAVPLYQHFSRVMLAHVMLETEAGPYLEKRREQARLARITFETLPAEEFPYLVEAAAQLGAPHDPERAFATGLDLLIAGLEQQRPAAQSNASTRRARR